MKLISSILSFFNRENIAKSILFMMILVACFGCSQPVFAANPQKLINATVEMTDGRAVWSGVIYKIDYNKLYILTIVHDDAMLRMKVMLGMQTFAINIEGSEFKEAKLLKWNPCTELAVFVVEDDMSKHFHSFANVALWNPPIGSKLLTAGNPLGQGIKYNEGIYSAKDMRANVCTRWSTYSGGTISGQTGSPIFNTNGHIMGMLTAVALTQMPGITEDSKQLVSLTPVYHMGYFVPLSEIKGFLRSLRGQKEIFF